MRHMWKSFVPVLVAGSLALPMMPAGGLADEAADVAMIRDLWVSYQTLAASGDGETWLELWDPDGIQMPPGNPMRDVAALAEVVPTWTPDDMDTMQIDPMEIVILGDTAYSMGTYWFDFPTGEGGQGRFEGKFMTLLKRQDDGSWKIYRDIFNSNTQ